MPQNEKFLPQEHEKLKKFTFDIMLSFLQYTQY